jgi:hypothetical protein
VKDLVIVQADGTFVHERGAEKMEAKAGMVYSRKARVSKGRVLITDKRTYAGVEEGAAFAEKLVLLAAQQGAFRAKQLWFVSDGALDLRRLRRQHFPTAVYFLDLWHLEHRIRDALGLEGEGQVGALGVRAIQGDVDGLIAELTEHWAASAEDEERHRLLGDLIPYVDANREGIENYRRRGPQGSVAIEKTIDIAVGRRLKAKGTSWYRPGAHRLRSLRTLKSGQDLEPVLAGPPLPHLPDHRLGCLMPEMRMHTLPGEAVDARAPCRLSLLGRGRHARRETPRR